MKFTSLALIATTQAVEDIAKISQYMSLLANLDGNTPSSEPLKHCFSENDGKARVCPDDLRCSISELGSDYAWLCIPSELCCERGALGFFNDKKFSFMCTNPLKESAEDLIEMKVSVK